jgi:hypothetical protein
MNTLDDLKKIATASELTLINETERLINRDITDKVMRNISTYFMNEINNMRVNSHDMEEIRMAWQRAMSKL